MMSNIIMEGHGSILPLPIKLLVAFAFTKMFFPICSLYFDFKNQLLSG